MTARDTASRRFSISAMIRWTTLLATLCIFSTSSPGQTTDSVIAPVDPAVRVTLQGQRAPWALPQNSQGPVPGYTMLEHLTLVLKRSPQRQKAFEQLLEELQDPASPNYHRFLTPVQVGERFGASEHDIDAISQWLRSQGLRVNSVANGRMMIDFGGNASVVSAAFATEMRYYLVNGERRVATAGDPQIPTALAGIIHSVSGLNTVDDHPYHGAGQAHVPAQGAGSDLPTLSICNGESCSYFITPDDFAVIYDVNNLYLGLGQTIAIIGRARVYLPDLQNFESLTGITFPDPTVIVPSNGQDPGPPAGTGGTASGDQVEATIDVMRAASVAPGASIDLVVSADDDAIGLNGIRVAAAYVVDTNPLPAQIMNISFGACEADRNLSDVQFWDNLFSQGAAEGISTFVSSGDSGAAGCDTYFQTPPATQIASPNYICASSYSTCVGGTEFADTADPNQYWSQSNSSYLESALMYIPEGGWNEPLNSDGATQAASSGGGYSSYIPTPSWQTGPGVPGTEGRYTPDIAFSASGHDGYFGCLAASTGPHPGNCVVQDDEFYFEYFFGTSAAAPDMAGITALLNQKLGGPQGELNQRLYQLAANPANAVFHDVTVATSDVSDCVVTTPSMCNNSTPSPTGLTGGLSGYLVTAGYDEVTGLGSIDVTNFLAIYTPPTFSWVNTGSTSATALSGQSATYTFTATPTGEAVTTFAANVTLSCGSLPDATVVCNFNPTQIAAGAGSTNVTLTITTTGPNANTANIRQHMSKNRSPLLPLTLPLAGIVLIGFAGRKMSRCSAIAGLSVSLALLGLLVACGSGSGNSGPPPVSVTVNPGVPASVFPNDAADAWPAQTAQFTATVSNTSNTAVTWAVTTPNGGTIDANGLYTAPTVAAHLPTSATITATSQADPTKSGSGQETLKPATVPGTYPNIAVTATESTTVLSLPVTLTVK